MKNNKNNNNSSINDKNKKIFPFFKKPYNFDSKKFVFSDNFYYLSIFFIFLFLFVSFFSYQFEIIIYFFPDLAVMNLDEFYKTTVVYGFYNLPFLFKGYLFNQKYNNIFKQKMSDDIIYTYKYNTFIRKSQILDFWKGYDKTKHESVLGRMFDHAVKEEKWEKYSKEKKIKKIKEIRPLKSVRDVETTEYEKVEDESLEDMDSLNLTLDEKLEIYENALNFIIRLPDYKNIQVKKPSDINIPNFVEYYVYNSDEVNYSAIDQMYDDLVFFDSDNMINFSKLFKYSFREEQIFKQLLKTNANQFENISGFFNLENNNDTESKLLNIVFYRYAKRMDRLFNKNRAPFFYKKNESAFFYNNRVNSNVKDSDFNDFIIPYEKFLGKRKIRFGEVGNISFKISDKFRYGTSNKRYDTSFFGGLSDLRNLDVLQKYFYLEDLDHRLFYDNFNKKIKYNDQNFRKNYNYKQSSMHKRNYIDYKFRELFTDEDKNFLTVTIKILQKLQKNKKNMDYEDFLSKQERLLQYIKRFQVFKYIAEKYQFNQFSIFNLMYDEENDYDYYTFYKDLNKVRMFFDKRMDFIEGFEVKKNPFPARDNFFRMFFLRYVYRIKNYYFQNQKNDYFVSDFIGLDRLAFTFPFFEKFGIIFNAFGINFSSFMKNWFSDYSKFISLFFYNLGNMTPVDKFLIVNLKYLFSFVEFFLAYFYVLPKALWDILTEEEEGETSIFEVEDEEEEENPSIYSDEHKANNNYMWQAIEPDPIYEKVSDDEYSFDVRYNFILFFKKFMYFYLYDFYEIPDQTIFKTSDYKDVAFKFDFIINTYRQFQGIFKVVDGLFPAFRQQIFFAFATIGLFLIIVFLFVFLEWYLFEELLDDEEDDEEELSKISSFYFLFTVLIALFYVWWCAPSFNIFITNSKTPSDLDP